MITELRIHGLKSIKDLTIPCKSLNIFAGINSSGKSTILQSLLMLSQSAGSNGENIFDGEFLKLGSFDEIQSKLCGKENIKIGVSFENDSKTDIEISEEGIANIGDFESLEFKAKRKEFFDLSYKKKFYHIPFDRIGVAETYPKNTTKTKFGLNCECALSYYDSAKKEVLPQPLEESLISTEDKNLRTLDSQVNYWLDQILGVKLRTFDENPKSSYVTATYEGLDGIEYRPMNVGSGISYIVSILIVCLASEKGSTILIENPEIHLHPKAQSRLVDFLYMIAKSGRQLFIETHSDHIFNGVRAGIATEQMSANEIAVNFIHAEKNETQVEQILFGKRGKIINPQNDLFDQFDIDLDKMLGI